MLKAEGQQGATSGGGWVGGTSAPNWQLKTNTGTTPFYIIPGKWYTIETYIKEGKGGTGGSGRFWLAITDKVTNLTATLGSLTTPIATESSLDDLNDGFKYIYPMKLYTSGNLIKAVNPVGTSPATPLQVSFDNYKLYNTK